MDRHRANGRRQAISVPSGARARKKRGAQSSALEMNQAPWRRPRTGTSSVTVFGLTQVRAGSTAPSLNLTELVSHHERDRYGNRAVCGLRFDNPARIIADLGPTFRDLSIGTLALCALFDCLGAV